MRRASTLTGYTLCAGTPTLQPNPAFARHVYACRQRLGVYDWHIPLCIPLFACVHADVCVCLYARARICVYVYDTTRRRRPRVFQETWIQGRRELERAHAHDITPTQAADAVQGETLRERHCERYTEGERDTEGERETLRERESFSGHRAGKQDRETRDTRGRHQTQGPHAGGHRPPMMKTTMCSGRAADARLPPSTVNSLSRNAATPPILMAVRQRASVG
jgi:hypothetical protein